MTLPTVVTLPPAGSPLSRAGRSGELPEWYIPVPRDAAAWRSYADGVRATVDSRWLGALHDAIVPGGAAAARLAASADGKGIVVTTGQQPGLFGGPLMSLVKAISARALADELQALTGMPVAPIFWAATDDADFDEASVVSVALEGGARELRLEQGAPTGTPMSSVPIGEDVHALAELLRAAAGSAPHASYLDGALHAYQAGATVGDAYLAVLRQVLQPLEIAVLDASHESVTRAASGLLTKAIRDAAPVAEAIRQRNADIEARGYTPQVVDVPGLSLVFLNSAGTKRRLSLADAASLGSLNDHQFLSATVLLRPILERSILPTAAYVAGPAELAYFAQASAVAEALGEAVPLVVPRWSTTLVEPRIQKLLDGLGIAAQDLVDPAAVEGRAARERLAPETANALHALRTGAASSVEALRRANGALVPEPVIDGLQRSIEHRIERVERRFLAAVKRRETDVMRQIGTARGALYPHGAPQERKLASIVFLARYGSSLLDAMLAEARTHARALVAGAARGGSAAARA